MLIIDADVHNDWSSAQVLRDHLPAVWRDYLDRGELPGPKGSFPHAHRPWLHPESFARKDVRPANEEDHFRLMKELHLDRYGISAAILTGEHAFMASTLANPYYADALVRACNDYMLEWWLPRDERLRGSILIPNQDPDLAAAEIRRLGPDERMVQVMAPHGTTTPYGNKFFWPIFEACAEFDLPFAVHLGGQGGVNSISIAGGNPSFYWEAHSLFVQNAMTHVASMIANGIFEKWPDLKFVVVECGVAWVPSLLWRLDANYRALRKETPWLKKLPSEYFRSNIRFTSQPLEQPEKPEHLDAMLDAMHADETLLFASDYPHWDFDAPDDISLRPELKERVLGMNALETYPRLRRLADRFHEAQGA